ncbi:MAG: non-histone chromosomal MC1 family protein [Euryarchaeota archaeon]|nr:non-histone chromosomal MC1 family protein [Euryarchaeota archaeon]
MTKSRTFVLRDMNGKEAGLFLGDEPRQAALQAANRSQGTKLKPVELRLREKGTKKVHIFKSWTEVVAAPNNKITGMPTTIKKPKVKKVSVETLDKVK